MAGNTNKKKNVVRKNASTRPTGFYYVLALIAVVGASILGYSLLRKPAGAVGTDVKIDPATAGPSEGYTLGKADAPVKIVEFADFECPGCGNFATVTEPDVRKRIIEPGLASLTFYDYPLPQHKNSRGAHNAAACAGDQGKFWEMHETIYTNHNGENQGAFSRSRLNTMAENVGLNMDQFKSCMDDNQKVGEVENYANVAAQAGVTSTPTFVINNGEPQGWANWENMKAQIDAALGQ